jgi:hypothetical protein
MELKSTDDGMTKFKNVPFCVLVKDDKDLAALRRDYASTDARERRMAADWEYHSQMASEIFNDSMAWQVKKDWESPFGLPGLSLLP